MKIVGGLIVLAIAGAVAFAFYTQHQRSLAAENAAREVECRNLRRTAEAERRPDGSLPADSRMLGIKIDVCQQEGR